MVEQNKTTFKTVGKPLWKSLLAHVEELHLGSIHPPFPPLPYCWEETAPNREKGVLYGSWDTIHIALDALNDHPQHAINQISNLLALQKPNGLLPGWVVCANQGLYMGEKVSFPPLWTMVVEDYFKITDDFQILEACLPKLIKQIEWFEHERKSPEGGFHYLDSLDRIWESGVVEGVRYDLGSQQDCCGASVDATSHISMLYDHAALWSERLGNDFAVWSDKSQDLKEFIQQKLFDKETGFFHDQWMVGDTHHRKLTFEGIWPLVAMAATSEQAQRVLNENLLDPSRFFTEHPIPTVALCDSKFELRNWRGPVRNSMTYWAVRGAMNYGRYDIAVILLEKALDASAKKFEESRAIWEYYNPASSIEGIFEDNELLLSKPCRDHLGHNPLIAMAKLWDDMTNNKEE